MQAYAAYKNTSGTWVKLSEAKNFQGGTILNLPKTSTTRQVHLRIVNVGSYEGVSVKTSGHWELQV